MKHCESFYIDKVDNHDEMIISIDGHSKVYEYWMKTC